MPASEARSATKGAALRAASGCFLLAFALGLGSIALSFLPREAGRSQWAGYRTLLVDSAVPEAEVLASLSAAGQKAILSESTAQVLVSDWSGLESLSLSEARSRIVQGDARLDDYLKRAGLWFEARANGVPYRAYYLREEGLDSGASIGRAIERGLAGKGWRYLLPDDFDSTPRPGRGVDLAFALSLAVILTACAVGPLLGRPAAASLGRGLDRAAFRLSLALPWAVLAGGGVTAAALAALWVLALAEAADALDMPLDEYWRGGGIRTVLESLSLQRLPSLALPFAALLASAANASLLPSLVLALLGSLAAIPGYALAATRPSSRRRFTPLPIAGRSSRGRRVRSAAGDARAALACAAVIAWCLCASLAPSLAPASSADIALPRPEPVRGSLRPMLAESRQRAPAEGGEVLPGLPSFLEHKARQEALPFARVGEARPDPFAPARLSLPPAASGTAGVDFSDEWARAAYASVPAISIEGMLLRQGSAMVGRVGSTGDAGGRNGRPLAPIQWLLYIFLLVPPLGKILLGAPNARRAASGELRQEA